MFDLPIDRATGRVAKTPYAVGYEAGASGHCIYGQGYSDSTRHAEYQRGWSIGYHNALRAELSAYNKQHGTNWEPRT